MTATTVNASRVIDDRSARDQLSEGIDRRFIPTRVRQLTLDDGSIVFGCELCDRVFTPTDASHDHRMHAIHQVRSHLGSHTPRRRFPTPKRSLSPTELAVNGSGKPLDVTALIDALGELAYSGEKKAKLREEIVYAEAEVNDWRQRTIDLEKAMRKIIKMLEQVLS